MLLDFAEFSCGPDSEALDVNVDYAAAAVHTTNRTPVLIGEVSHLGRTRGVREPQVSFGSGGPVKKVGARTGFTKGEIVAISSGKTRSGKRINTVFEVEGPSDSYFACEGDSGSVVVDDDGYILGILSWGDSVQCGEAGSSYFWAFEHANRAGKQFTFHVDL
jgi:hypothetical protein